MEREVVLQQQQFVQSSRIGTWKEKKETQEHNKAYSNWLFDEKERESIKQQQQREALQDARHANATNKRVKTTTTKKRRAEVWHEIKQKLL